MQPRAGQSPVSSHSRIGNFQDFGGSIDAQSAKEAQFDNFALAGIKFCQVTERFIKRDDVTRPGLLWSTRC
jgi:hypothetical protein